MEILFERGEVIIPIPKAVLVMTRQQFIEALKRGKAFPRAQERQARVAPIEGNDRGVCCGQYRRVGLCRHVTWIARS
jgi:hypothetical protein